MMKKGCTPNDYRKKEKKGKKKERENSLFTWSVRDGAVGTGATKSQSFTNPMTVVSTTMLSDFSSSSKHVAERD